MTRQEYLSELRYCLKTLPVEEQEEALEYYRGYFEDAEDDERVMREFGSPEELAQGIVSKFASVPAVSRKSGSTDGEGTYGNFSEQEVHSLDISVGIAEVVISGEGDDFSVEYRNLFPGDIKCTLSPFGTLCVENNRRIPDFTLFKRRDDGGVNHARVLIKIPAKCRLSLLRVHVDAGSLVTKNVCIEAQRIYADVGAGDLRLTGVYGGAADLHAGMGHLLYKGKATGLIRVECGMGQVGLELNGDVRDYSIDAKVGFGSVRLNDIKKNGIGNLECKERKANHFSVSCGFGEVYILVNEV